MQDDKQQIPTRRNPLFWLGLIMAGLILFVLASGDREGPQSQVEPTTSELNIDDAGVINRAESQPQSDPSVDEAGIISRVDSESQPDSFADEAGTIDRNLLIPPGMRAREYVAQLKQQGQPYPLDEAMQRAADYQQDGSLADAYILYFFAAREGHTASMLEIARLNDPRYFKPNNALLDEPDAVQALTWYRKAEQAGDEQATAMLQSLRGWAETEAAGGSEMANQILLNFR